MRRSVDTRGVRVCCVVCARAGRLWSVGHVNGGERRCIRCELWPWLWRASEGLTGRAGEGTSCKARDPLMLNPWCVDSPLWW